MRQFILITVYGLFVFLYMEHCFHTVQFSSWLVEHLYDLQEIAKTTWENKILQKALSEN